SAPCFCFFFSSRRRHTSSKRDWSQTCALPISRFSAQFCPQGDTRGKEFLSCAAGRNGFPLERGAFATRCPLPRFRRGEGSAFQFFRRDKGGRRRPVHRVDRAVPFHPQVIAVGA